MDIVDNDIKEMLYNIIETYELDDEITDNIIELEKSIVEMICNNMNSLYDDFEKMYVENVKKIVKEELGKKNIIEEDVNKIDTISISDASENESLDLDLSEKSDIDEIEIEIDLSSDYRKKKIDEISEKLNEISLGEKKIEKLLNENVVKNKEKEKKEKVKNDLINTIVKTIDNLVKERDEEYFNNIKKKLVYLRNRPQPDQRSEEWYNFRNGMLTASDLYKAIGSEAKIRDLVIKKCKPSSKKSGGSRACEHGVKYEPVATELFEIIFNVVVEEFGCIQHPNFQIFGASPDGICNEESGDYMGTMLEIKCPYSREIIQGQIPEMYWMQIQGQLEVCDLEECAYWECNLQEYEGREEYYKDGNSCKTEKGQYKGVVISIYNNETESVEYMYSKIGLNKEDLEEWIDEVIGKVLDKEELTFLCLNWWWLESYTKIIVRRDRDWFNNMAKPKIESFWEKVEYHRKNGIEELLSKRKPRKKKVEEKVDICIIGSDSDE
tara:strand:+ start:4061 stop:5545 length:1485 start_codon:yes stop_codon:yes gene_type:complete